MNLTHVKNLEDLKKAKHQFYEGEIKSLQESIKTAPPQERGSIGKKITEMKLAAEKAFEEKMVELKNIEIQKRIDSE